MLYLVTGSILLPIALHALIDLRSLVLIPIALGGAWGLDAPARGYSTGGAPRHSPGDAA